MDERARALNIKRIWDDTDFQSVLAEYDAEIVRRWQSATTPEAREACHAEHRMLDQFKVKLRGIQDIAVLAETLDTRHTRRTQRSARKEH